MFFKIGVIIFNKEEIDKKRQEFENILLYTPNGKKQIKPTPPKNIGISI